MRIFISAVILFMANAAACFAFSLDPIKVSFLEGDYSSLISKGEILLKSSNPQQSAELNYLLGMVYLKVAKTQNAIEYLEMALKTAKGSFREEVNLGLADAYLLKEDYNQARVIYNSILQGDGRTKLKAAIYFRLSQLESGAGKRQLAGEYRDKLKKEFPLSLELRSSGFAPLACPLSVSGEGYSVQVGYFSSPANAVKFRDKLINEGFPAYIEEAAGACRVKVGRFNNRQQAAGMQERLSAAGYPTKVCP